MKCKGKMINLRSAQLNRVGEVTTTAHSPGAVTHVKEQVRGRKVCHFSHRRKRGSSGAVAGSLPGRRPPDGGD